MWSNNDCYYNEANSRPNLNNEQYRPSVETHSSCDQTGFQSPYPQVLVHERNVTLPYLAVPPVSHLPLTNEFPPTAVPRTSPMPPYVPTSLCSFAPPLSPMSFPPPSFPSPSIQSVPNELQPPEQSHHFSFAVPPPIPTHKYIHSQSVTNFNSSHNFKLITPQLNNSSGSQMIDYTKMSLEVNTSIAQEDKWFHQWISKHNISLRPPKLHKPKHTLISVYKKKITDYFIKIKKLERMWRHLIIMQKVLDDDNWISRTMEAEDLKRKLSSSFIEIQKIPLSEIKCLLKERSKRRSRLKRKMKEHKERRKEMESEKAAEHARIDMWLQQMSQLVENSRRDEEVKRQADVVLSNVIQKKAEAKITLNLLTTLRKLRNTRIQNRKARGEYVSTEAASTFNEIIDKIKNLWLEQIKEYNIEEQGLNVMLNDAETERCNIEKSLNKQILKKWLTLLFGEQECRMQFEPVTKEQLIDIRKSWDKYIIKENNTVHSTSLPAGWVFPSPPSSDAWAKFLE